MRWCTRGDKKTPCVRIRRRLGHGGGFDIISVKCFYLTAVTVLDKLMSAELFARLSTKLCFQAWPDLYCWVEWRLQASTLLRMVILKVNVKSIVLAPVYARPESTVRATDAQGCWLDMCPITAAHWTNNLIEPWLSCVYSTVLRLFHYNRAYNLRINTACWVYPQITQ